MEKIAGFCIDLLQRVLHNLTPFSDGHCISECVLDSLAVSLEIAYRVLIVLDLTEKLSSVQKEGVEIVRLCLIMSENCKGNAAFKSALRIKKIVKNTLCPYRSSWSIQV